MTDMSWGGQNANEFIMGFISSAYSHSRWSWRDFVLNYFPELWQNISWLKIRILTLNYSTTPPIYLIDHGSWFTGQNCKKLVQGGATFVIFVSRNEMRGMLAHEEDVGEELLPSHQTPSQLKWNAKFQIFKEIIFSILCHHFHLCHQNTKYD